MICNFQRDLCLGDHLKISPRNFAPETQINNIIKIERPTFDCLVRNRIKGHSVDGFRTRCEQSTNVNPPGGRDEGILPASDKYCVYGLAYIQIFIRHWINIVIVGQNKICDTTRHYYKSNMKYLNLSIYCLSAGPYEHLHVVNPPIPNIKLIITCCHTHSNTVMQVKIK